MARYQKQHFEDIAIIFHENLTNQYGGWFPHEDGPPLSHIQELITENLRNLAIQFAVVFSKHNPNFDRTKFLEACGFDLKEGEYHGK